MEQFLQAETLVIELLVVVSIVAVVVRRYRLPYTVALVIVGLLITVGERPDINLSSELILALFVPPLVFEAAFHLSFGEIRKNLAGLLLLAVPGVILTMLIVGGLTAWGVGLAMPVALVFGALIAATDPVAVVAIFKALGVPRRLAVLVEGESLFNDGTALVVFNLMVAALLTGSFNAVEGVIDFLRVAIGGVVVGLALGWVVSRFIAQIDDYLIETTLTTVLAFGSYLLAERFHFSGVLAVVVAGLVNGNLGPQGMSPTTRIVLFNFWEYVAFLANSLIFLLLGLQVNIPDLLNNWQPIVWAIGAALIARIVVIYSLGWLTNRFIEPVPLRWQHVMAWGGLRGALSLALALSLPVAMGPDRDLLRLMAFGVVLFTLLVQGTTMGPLLQRLRIGVLSDKHLEYEKRHARLGALQVAQTHLDQQHRTGLISTPAWETLKNELVTRKEQFANELHGLMESEPILRDEELKDARGEMLRAQRGALHSMRLNGVISDTSYEELATEIDYQLSALDEPPEEEPEAAEQAAAVSEEKTSAT